eukprot:2626162-Lingulodinium_polyedra.AAC.1
MNAIHWPMGARGTHGASHKAIPMSLDPEQPPMPHVSDFSPTGLGLRSMDDETTRPTAASERTRGATLAATPTHR